MLMMQNIVVMTFGFQFLTLPLTGYIILDENLWILHSQNLSCGNDTNLKMKTKTSKHLKDTQYFISMNLVAVSLQIRHVYGSLIEVFFHMELREADDHLVRKTSQPVTACEAYCLITLVLRRIIRRIEYITHAFHTKLFIRKWAWS
jgi:hypothetical protein